MKKKKPVVVGIGEVLLDVYPDSRKLGGAPANFAYHARLQGCDGFIVSAVGHDPDGEKIISDLKAQHVPVDYIQRNDHASGLVTVTLKNGKPSYNIRQDVAWDFIDFTPELESLSRTVNAVCFGSLAQRSEVSGKAIIKFVNTVPPQALKVFDVNLRQHYFSRHILELSLQAANILKVSDDEFDQFHETLQLNASGDNTEDKLKNIMSVYDIDSVLLSRGAEGCDLIEKGKVIHEPACNLGPVIDTVGCGDSLTAGFVAALLCGRTPIDALRHAVRVSGYVSTCRGATPQSLPQSIML